MSGNKKLKQHDLRKAMHDLKMKNKAVIKRIESPLAKYTETGQLMCIVCKSIVRSETIWPVHLSSKSHKENIILTKKSLDRTSQVAGFKRPSSPTREAEPSKKIKSILKNPGHPQIQTALPADFFDQATTHDRTIVATVACAPAKCVTVSNDKTKEASMEIEGDKNPESAATATLPEGFFDDPIMDAKVRNVEYKDPIEEEWDKFQKEIKEETAQSEQIIADDHEEAITVRHTDEIDEQMNCYSRVMNLVRVKEKLPPKQNKPDPIDEDISSGEENLHDSVEFLDWRVKNSFVFD